MCIPAQTEVNEEDVVCMCVSVCMSACSVLYLAALNSSASCSLNHEHEVIQLMIEPVCVCVNAVYQNGKALVGFSRLIAILL